MRRRRPLRRFNLSSMGAIRFPERIDWDLPFDVQPTILVAGLVGMIHSVQSITTVLRPADNVLRAMPDRYPKGRTIPNKYVGIPTLTNTPPRLRRRWYI